jgi:UDP-N-acetylmuramoyl-L-alanyl-D-glutamate--2,6-diaminopimelate ligase
MTYGLKKKADLQAKNLVLTANGTRFDLVYQDQEAHCHWPHIGRYNVYNCLAALSAGLVRGYPLKQLVDIISTAEAVPGRLEPVANNLGLKIFVDYAHTDDSLANVLSCLQEIAGKRIITVFGCGGDRDKGKRPRMARVAEELSDFCIVTSDNPRSEDPLEICTQIASAFEKKNHVLEVDRKRAIALAIDMAKPEDIILLAGKGHETYQIFAHRTIDFDDRRVAFELCEANAKVTL